MSFFCAMQASATVVCKNAGTRLYKCTHKSTIKFQWLVVKLYNLPDNNICLFDQLCQRLLVRDVGLNWLRVLVASSQTFGFFEHVACYDGKSCFRCISFLLFFFTTARVWRDIPMTTWTSEREQRRSTSGAATIPEPRSNTVFLLLTVRGSIFSRFTCSLASFPFAAIVALDSTGDRSLPPPLLLLRLLCTFVKPYVVSYSCALHHRAIKHTNSFT